MVVVDASVFNKLFLDETDRHLAVDLFRHAIETDIQLIAPNLLLYEALSAAMHYGVPFAVVHRQLSLQRAAGMRLIEPTARVLELAERIATSGNTKAGCPAVPDSIYHALAIETQGSFVTADSRHVAKAKQFGSVTLLSDYKTRPLTQR